MTDRVFEPDDDALGQNEVPYLLKDLYTVAGLADERGWPVERYDYDAYGKVHMNRCAVLPWAADFDGDGHVDQNDLTVFLDAYGGSGEEPNGPRGWRADLDGDGDVDGSDYVLFADAYNGAGDPPRPPSPTVSVGSMGLTTGPMVASRVGNPYFFTGRRLDVMDKQDAGTPHHFTDDYAGLQLYDYRARTDDPVMGRFNQRDPAEYQDGMNLYEYVGSWALASVDPTGLFRDANGKECVIKSCRRYADLSHWPPWMGHSWIELDGHVYDHPAGYDSHHNWATSCSEAYPEHGADVGLPGGSKKPAKCATCDEFKNCIKRSFVNILRTCKWRKWPRSSNELNCIEAKNRMLRECGLDDGYAQGHPWIDDPILIPN